MPGFFRKSKQRAQPDDGAEADDLGQESGAESGRARGPLGRFSGWLLRLALALAVAFGLGYLPLQFFGEKGLTQYRRLKKELSEIKARNDRLAGDIYQMRLEVRRLRDDDVALEKAARDDLGMVRQGELIFVLKD